MMMKYDRINIILRIDDNKTNEEKTMKFREKLQLKKDIIQKYVEEMQKPVKIGKNNFIYTKEDIDTAIKELNKLSLKRLQELKSIKETKPKHSIGDKVSAISTKRAMNIKILNKNGTDTEYTVSKYNRFLSLNKFKYLLPPGMGRYNTKHKMLSYTFFEHNPMPIVYGDNEYLSTVDTELLQQSLHFEFAQKMAKVGEITKTMNLTMVFVILTFVLSAIHLVVYAKESGLI